MLKALALHYEIRSTNHENSEEISEENIKSLNRKQTSSHKCQPFDCNSSDNVFE